MSSTNDLSERSEPESPTSAGVWSWQFWVVVALLLAFGALVVAMMMLADGKDLVWQRRVYVFASVEAIVFTAVGWLFGREVHRTEARSARRDAAAAKTQAAQAQMQASDQRDRAEAAQQSAVAERVRGEAVKAAISSMVAANREGDAESVGPVDASGARHAPVDRPAFGIDLPSFVAMLYAGDSDG